MYTVSDIYICICRWEYAKDVVCVHFASEYVTADAFFTCTRTKVMCVSVSRTREHASDKLLLSLSLSLSHTHTCISTHARTLTLASCICLCAEEGSRCTSNPNKH